MNFARSFCFVVFSSELLLSCSGPGEPAEERALLDKLQAYNTACNDQQSRDCDQAETSRLAYLAYLKDKHFENWVCEVYGIDTSRRPGINCANGLNFKLATQTSEKIFPHDVVAISGKFLFEDSSEPGGSLWLTYGTITRLSLTTKGG